MIIRRIMTHPHLSCKSALFNFESLLLVIILLICTCAYVKAQLPSLMDRNKTGYQSCGGISGYIRITFMVACTLYKKHMTVCTPMQHLWTVLETGEDR